mgnify:CR=1 FL=1
MIQVGFEVGLSIITWRVEEVGILQELDVIVDLIVPSKVADSLYLLSPGVVMGKHAKHRLLNWILLAPVLQLLVLRFIRLQSHHVREYLTLLIP